MTPATAGQASSVDEPSVANDGNVVLYTGNWYAAESTDSGATFSYINPYTLGPAPTLPNGGFCCDQVAIHSPSANDVTAWGLLYCNVTDCSNGIGDNLIRLAVARNQANLASSTFDYYDFSAQSFGFAEGDWVDYPHFGLGANSLYLTMNIFDSSSNFVSDIMVRFDLSTFAGGGWSADWYFNNQDFTWTSADTSHDSFGYWASTVNGGDVRVYDWPEGTDFHSVGWNDFAVGFNYETRGSGFCPAPDGGNWCGFDDSRVKTGGEIGASTVYFMWGAAQGGGFPYPYVDYAAFDVSTGPATSKLSESQIWNSNYAWAYPGMGIDAAGNFGVSIAIGGGTWGYPGSQFLIADDVTGGGFAAVFLDQGTHSTGRWGDFLTSRGATSPGSAGNSWVVTGYVIHDSGVSPHFYWVGRQRDDPFTPTFGGSYNNNFYSEGGSFFADTGWFYGPSNCACDYAANNDWGDGGFDAAGVSLVGPSFPLDFYITGTHTYRTAGTLVGLAVALLAGCSSGSHRGQAGSGMGGQAGTTGQLGTTRQVGTTSQIGATGNVTLAGTVVRPFDKASYQSPDNAPTAAEVSAAGGQSAFLAGHACEPRFSTNFADLVPAAPVQVKSDQGDPIGNG